VSDAEAEAYYKDHAAEFEEPKRLRVAHVLVRVPPVGGSDAENAAKAKVEDVIKRAKGGEDFAKLAREISEDKASAVQGGDLGFVGAGELVAPFEQAAFALKKGEISAPVRTPFGYHAIRVLDVKEGGKMPLKEVAPKIKETLGAQKSEQAAQTRADEVRATLLSAKEFPAEAKRLGLEPQEATFGRGDALGEAGRDPQLDETLFGLAVGGVSTPIKTAGGFAIVKIAQLIPAGVPPVAEIRDRVMEAIKRERAEQQVIDKAKALVTTLGKGGDFAAAAKADGFSTGSIPLFSRSDPPKERGSLPGGVLVAALQTPAGQVAEPVRADGGVYVVKTLERAAAAPDGLEKERAELEKQVLEQKRALAWDNWIRGRLADSKVQVGGRPATLTR
jgi:peptidyl-prolyl cis-trans isomerase D